MSINVIKATIVIHKVNMISKSNLLKLNLIACHGNERNLKCHTGRNSLRLKWFRVRLKTIYSSKTKISVSVLELKVIKGP